MSSYRLAASHKSLCRPVTLVMAVCSCLLAISVQAEDSDYLKAMKEASETRQTQSNDKQKPATVPAETAPVATGQAGSEVVAEFENGLSAGYPEEFALYKKLDDEQRAEVIAEFSQSMDQPDSIRYMKAINRIGLLSGSGDWEL